MLKGIPSLSFLTTRFVANNILRFQEEISLLNTQSKENLLLHLIQGLYRILVCKVLQEASLMTQTFCS